MKAQRERFFTFFSDFRFLLNNLTEPNRRFGKVLSDNFLNKILLCLFMNTVPMYHRNSVARFYKQFKYFFKIQIEFIKMIIKSKSEMNF
jgi:hypothetical protein